MTVKTSRRCEAFRAYLDKAITKRITANADHTASMKLPNPGLLIILFVAVEADCMNVFMLSMASLTEGGAAAQDTAGKTNMENTSKNTVIHLDLVIFFDICYYFKMLIINICNHPPGNPRPDRGGGGHDVQKNDCRHLTS